MSSPIEWFVEHHEVLKPLTIPVSLLIAAAIALVHNPLHVLVERVCAPRWYRARVQMKALAQRLNDDDDLTEADIDRALVQGTASALWLERAALFVRQRDDLFVARTTFNWPSDASQELRGDHPWARSTVSGPVLLADPDDAPEAPAVVVPIRWSRRRPANRLAIYGHHVTRERLDPDEIRVLGEVSRAAAVAYMRLDLESRSAAPVGNVPAAPPAS